MSTFRMSHTRSARKDPEESQQRPKKLDREATSTSRSESAGGVPLPQANSNTTNSKSRATAELPGSAPSRRRRPRKINRTAEKASPTSVSAPKATIPHLEEPAVKPEIDALKDRVEGIERQLHELLQRAPPKLSRRRQRQRKLGEPESRNEPQEELVRLEGELRSARRELEHIRTRSATRSDVASSIAEDEDVEEIPRPSEPTTATTLNSRDVTLSGSYRLPIAFSASEAELQSIQAGISSAQRLARIFLDANPLYNSVSTDRAFVSRNTVTRSGENWSEWYGGYNMTLSRPARPAIEANTLRPTAATPARRNTQPPKLVSNLRTTTTNPPTRRAPPKLEIRSGNAMKGARSTASIRRAASVPASAPSQSQISSLLS